MGPNFKCWIDEQLLGEEERWRGKDKVTVVILEGKKSLYFSVPML